MSHVQGATCDTPRASSVYFLLSFSLEKGVKAGDQCECAVNLGENLVLFRSWENVPDVTC